MLCIFFMWRLRFFHSAFTLKAQFGAQVDQEGKELETAAALGVRSGCKLAPGRGPHPLRMTVV
jgi:hypothetical protein